MTDFSLPRLYSLGLKWSGRLLLPFCFLSIAAVVFLASFSTVARKITFFTSSYSCVIDYNAPFIGFERIGGSTFRATAARSELRIRPEGNVLINDFVVDADVNNHCGWASVSICGATSEFADICSEVFALHSGENVFRLAKNTYNAFTITIEGEVGAEYTVNNIALYDNYGVREALWTFVRFTPFFFLLFFALLSMRGHPQWRRIDALSFALAVSCLCFSFFVSRRIPSDFGRQAELSLVVWSFGGIGCLMCLSELMIRRYRGRIDKGYISLFVAYSLSFLLFNLCCRHFRDDETMFNDFHALGIAEMIDAYKAQVGYGTAWSSRFLLDVFMLSFCGWLPFVCWKFANTFVGIALVYTLNRVFNPERSVARLVIILACNLALPYHFMITAGWGATTIIYYWPFVAVVVAFALLYEYRVRGGLWRFVVALPLVAVGADNELMCVMLIVLFAMFGLWGVLRREGGVACFSFAVVLLARLTLHFFWSQNGVRMAIEAERYFPDIVNLTVADKTLIGVTTTMHFLFVEQSLLPLLFSVVVAVLVFVRGGSWAVRSFALFPVAMFALSVVGVARMSDAHYSALYGSFAADSPMIAYLPPLVWACALAALVACVVRVSDNGREAFILVSVLAAGFISRVPMGFSPTNYASSSRTFFFLYCCIGACMLYLLMREWRRFESGGGKGARE